VISDYNEVCEFVREKTLIDVFERERERERERTHEVKE
jgi:hypothetical protein